MLTTLLNLSTGFFVSFTQLSLFFLFLPYPNQRTKGTGRPFPTWWRHWPTASSQSPPFCCCSSCSCASLPYWACRSLERDSTMTRCQRSRGATLTLSTRAYSRSSRSAWRHPQAHRHKESRFVLVLSNVLSLSLSLSPIHCFCPRHPVICYPMFFCSNNPLRGPLELNLSCSRVTKS